MYVSFTYINIYIYIYILYICFFSPSKDEALCLVEDVPHTGAAGNQVDSLPVGPLAI